MISKTFTSYKSTLKWVGLLALDRSVSYISGGIWSCAASLWRVIRLLWQRCSSRFNFVSFPPDLYVPLHAVTGLRPCVSRLVLASRKSIPPSAALIQIIKEMNDSCTNKRLWKYLNVMALQVKVYLNQAEVNDYVFPNWTFWYFSFFSTYRPVIPVNIML